MDRRYFVFVDLTPIYNHSNISQNNYTSALGEGEQNIDKQRFNLVATLSGLKEVATTMFDALAVDDSITMEAPSVLRQEYFRGQLLV